MGIRENIIRLREEHDLTQEQLAKIAGVSRGAVSQWEGGFSEPRMGSIQKMADHFGLSKSNIIEDNGMISGIPGARPIRATRHATVPLRRVGKVQPAPLRTRSCSTARWRCRRTWPRRTRGPWPCSSRATAWTSSCPRDATCSSTRR